jgi:UDP-N-acetylmuramyl pentapeptide phosphotransferase/UDP-N-acetylglucosamine-1-phosphate transferase
MNAPIPIKGANTIIALLCLAAVGIAAYWVSFFFGGDVQASQEQCYLVFQRTFPVPDGATALCAALSAIGLYRRKQWAVLWGLIAAGGILFLGLIDTTFNVQNNIYGKVSGEVGTEIVINIFCLTLAPTLAAFLWHNRHKLEA